MEPSLTPAKSNAERLVQTQDLLAQVGRTSQLRQACPQILNQVIKFIYRNRLTLFISSGKCRAGSIEPLLWALFPLATLEAHRGMCKNNLKVCNDRQQTKVLCRISIKSTAIRSNSCYCLQYSMYMLPDSKILVAISAGELDAESDMHPILYTKIHISPYV
jgi:hypothetical protein